MDITIKVRSLRVNNFCWEGWKTGFSFFTRLLGGIGEKCGAA